MNVMRRAGAVAVGAVLLAAAAAPAQAEWSVPDPNYRLIFDDMSTSEEGRVGLFMCFVEQTPSVHYFAIERDRNFEFENAEFTVIAGGRMLGRILLRNITQAGDDRPAFGTSVREGDRATVKRMLEALQTGARIVLRPVDMVDPEHAAFADGIRIEPAAAGAPFQHILSACE